MSAPLSDADLTRWAREHLVYEGRMLAFAAMRLAEREGVPRDPESNVLLESFIVHVRCLRDFLWGKRWKSQPKDAFAFDFCEPGKWERQRPVEPPALVEIGTRRRAGREVVHLTYHRLTIHAESKDWDYGEIYADLADALDQFAQLALPSRLDQNTQDALQDLSKHTAEVGPASVATGAAYGLATRGGTVGFPGFQHGS
jgi:hypothetical protein